MGKNETYNCKWIDIKNKKSYNFANLLLERINPGGIIIDSSQLIYVFGGHLKETAIDCTSIERNNINSPSI